MRRKVEKTASRVFAYIRVSTEKQDMHSQDHAIECYAQQHRLSIDEKIAIEISATKTQAKRRIEELKAKLQKGGLLIATEISRLGRTMHEIINLLLELDKRGIKFVFIRQPELSNCNSATSKLLLAIYAYLAEAERELISERTKAGLQALKAKGKKLGWQKGRLRKHPQYDPHLDYIRVLRAKGLGYMAIYKMLDVPTKGVYGGFLKWCKRRGV
ncbi:Site-specific recombinase, resolvase family [Helicobacter heilmannii]|uniref:recombinase family protein n=1 Tax=Helicobacter TaxID=209 RepID=UPI0006A159DD|nr:MULTISPECIES: recombinase family protein [Helicobacter]BEG58317.1 recombinase family protein [Helicobacter sp. NHP21005]CRF50050.1 Site-specific recombinase, resolvase family [Helicobacter heilmannii]